MLEYFLIGCAVFAELIILAFAWVGVKLTYKAWVFAAELQLSDYRYRKERELRNRQVAEDEAEAKK